MHACAHTGMKQALKVDLWSPGRGLSHVTPPIGEVHGKNVPTVVRLADGFIQCDSVRMSVCQLMKPLVQRGIVELGAEKISSYKKIKLHSSNIILVGLDIQHEA